jgi:hypothetical protein
MCVEVQVPRTTKHVWCNPPFWRLVGTSAETARTHAAPRRANHVHAVASFQTFRGSRAAPKAQTSEGPALSNALKTRCVFAPLQRHLQNQSVRFNANTLK